MGGGAALDRALVGPTSLGGAKGSVRRAENDARLDISMIDLGAAAALISDDADALGTVFILRRGK